MHSFSLPENTKFIHGRVVYTLNKSVLYGTSQNGSLDGKSASTCHEMLKETNTKIYEIFKSLTVCRLRTDYFKNVWIFVLTVDFFRPIIGLII